MLVWIFSNFALAATILNGAGLDRLTVGKDGLPEADNAAVVEAERSTIYLSIVLWSVAGLSAFRFLGATWFLIVRLVCIWMDPLRAVRRGCWVVANGVLVPGCITLLHLRVFKGRNTLYRTGF